MFFSKRKSWYYRFLDRLEKFIQKLRNENPDLWEVPVYVKFNTLDAEFVYGDFTIRITTKDNIADYYDVSRILIHELVYNPLNLSNSLNINKKNLNNPYHTYGWINEVDPSEVSNQYANKFYYNPKDDKPNRK